MIKKTHIFLEDYKFILFGHILNPLWNSRLKRRQKRGKSFYNRINNLLSPYREFVENLKMEDYAASGNETGKIFSIWFQGENKAPDLIKVCFERARTLYGDRFIVLDSSTLFDWIELPDYIIRKWKEGKITYAHFSDICRIALLYKNGGIWLDATDYLTSKVPSWIEEAPLFIYLAGDVITPESFIQSCFMKAEKGFPLLKALLDFLFEYWKNEDSLIDYFLLHFMLRYLVEHNRKAEEIFLSMPQICQEPTHVLWHLHSKDPYSEENYKEWTKDTFFQKTSFKDKEASEPTKGSVAEYILNKKTPMP